MIWRHFNKGSNWDIILKPTVILEKNSSVFRRGLKEVKKHTVFFFNTINKLFFNSIHKKRVRTTLKFSLKTTVIHWQTVFEPLLVTNVYVQMHMHSEGDTNIQA